jgi:hypothetical protein
MPEIDEIATTHLFLVPVSFCLFLLLSWLRRRRDDTETEVGVKPFARWRATLGIWLLLFLHPVSCGLYPAAFNLDTRTVEEISRAVAAMQVGMPRAAVEQRIVELNATLPVSMGTDQDQHHKHQAETARYLAETEPTARRILWPVLSRATLVFIPWDLQSGGEPDREAREQGFSRRIRTSSDIGVDMIRIRYGPSFTVEEIVYSSNRQLLMERQPCTIRVMIPVPTEASFPYPCPK